MRRNVSIPGDPRHHQSRLPERAQLHDVGPMIWQEVAAGVGLWYDYGMIKIAVTIPEDQMRSLERLRRKQRIPRSRIVQQALRCYFAQTGIAEDARAYEEGYRRKPEQAQAAESYARVAAEVLEHENWS